MDSLETHKQGSPYEVFPQGKALNLWNRFEFMFTSKHCPWLNMSEIELNVLIGQCLNRRIDNLKEVINQVKSMATSKKTIKIQKLTGNFKLKMPELN